MTKELTANTTLSHYRILSKISEGGMGEVYLAQDTSELGRSVALKIVSAEVAKDKDRLQRFTQEARTVSNLNHPNILTIYEFGQADSISFIAAEFVDGVTLREHLSGRRLKLIDMLDVATQIVGALNAAHEAGVTHRDLKPDNIMIRKDHIVKVLDFGLAKLTQPEAIANETGSEDATRLHVNTTPGLIMGTVAYMSPEQSVGAGIDHRTDIWSTGVVLYEMIAGCVPFQGKDIHRQIIAIQESEALPLSQQVEGVPERLEEIITKCLAKEKEERYQTAKDLLIDLRNLRRKLDVDAEIERTVAPTARSTGAGAGSVSTQSATMLVSPTSSAEYVVSEIRRHKLAASLVALLLIGGGIALALFMRSRSVNSAGAINSIAVLPFQNKSSDADTDYLSDGLAESLIYRLSQLPNLKVSPTSAVMRYKGKEIDAQQIAKELGVQSVVSGRLIQRGENLSVSVELVDAANNKIIWGELYERKMSDLLATQREIATTITDKLKLKLSGEKAKGITRRYTENNEAYQLYLKGRFLWNQRKTEPLKRAVKFYNLAIEKDPGFALAYAGLAETYVLYSNYEVSSPADCMPQAKAAALRALALDDSLAEAHSALGWYLGQFEYDWNGAEKELRKAIDLNPNYATAHQWLASILEQTKRFEDAQAEVERASDLDPLSPIISANIGYTFLMARRVDESIPELNRTLSLHPDFPVALEGLCLAYITKHDSEKALNFCRKSFEVTRSSADKGYLAFALGRAGQSQEARKLLQELKLESGQRYIPKTALAVANLGLNEKEEALLMLEQEAAEHGYWVGSLAIDPSWDELRSEPRFKALLKRVNLPE